MAEATTPPDRTTPPSWSSLKDPREMQGAGTYPNYYSHKTRSGHCFMMDDSSGTEHITLQHRGGSAVQFLPDGSMQFVCSRRMFQLTFGDNKVYISGAQDITVQGDASLKVEGNYNMNVKGNMNIDVNGDYNITAQNSNHHIRGNIDIQAKNRTEKIEGSASSQAQGGMSLKSKFGMSIMSTGDSVAIGASSKIGVYAKGELMLKGDGKTSIKSGSMIAMDGITRVNSNDSSDALSDLSFSSAPKPSEEPDTPAYTTAV